MAKQKLNKSQQSDKFKYSLQIIISPSMGNRESLTQQLQIYKPPIDQFIFKQSGQQFRIYQHKYKNYEIMAHKLTLNHERQLPALIENFKARYQHHYLVSTLYLACEDYSTCGGYFETVVFYQRVFTNLSKIKDIPFSDVLHFYAVAFKGFQILFRRFGYFQIYEDMFHLGQDSKLKVWCNKDISKNQPQPYLLDMNGTEEDMIRKIIFIISENTDPYTDRINLKDKLLRFGVRNFEMANQSLREICRQYNLSVPQRIQCITSLPSQQVKNMLDQYTSNSQILNQNISTPDLNSQLSSPLPFPNNNNISQTPYFPQPALSHTPITQQFMLQSSNSDVPQLRFPPKKMEVTQQSMIHTFNKRPQIPEGQRKGIDLSLSTKSRKNSSFSNQTPNSGRNYSLPTRNGSQMTLNNNTNNLSGKYYSLQKRPDIKINFSNKNFNIPTKSPQGINIQPTPNKQFQVHLPIELGKYQHSSQKTVNKPQNRHNYHVQPAQVQGFAEPQKNPIIYVHSPQRYYSQPQQIQVMYPPQAHIKKYQIPQNSQRSSQLLRKSNHSVNFHNPSIQNNLQNSSFVNSSQKYVVPTYEPTKYQARQRRASSKKNGQNFNQSNTMLSQTQKVMKYGNQQTQIHKEISQNTSLGKTMSTPILNQENKPDRYQPAIQKQSPFLQINDSHPSSPSHLQVNINPNVSSPQFNAHTTSSRYVYSNKQINDNIPESKIKKASPKKLVTKLFDTKLQELQSFNESKFGTQNSLKDHNYENSQVLEIIGRQKKDSVASAFDDDNMHVKTDEVKESDQNSSNFIKFENPYKYGDSFTDPKILQILKRPSSKALKNELNNIKKVSKTTKPIEFSNDFIKRPVMSKDIKQDILKFSSNWQKQNEKKTQSSNQKLMFENFQGFPSLSNLSQINKVEDNSFNQDKSNLVLSAQKNLSKKSRFSEQKQVTKKEENAVSQFYQFEYQSPTYEYSFSSKKQVPMQDTEWKAKYGTTINSLKDQSTKIYNKGNDFRVAPQKPFNHLTGFNSNESLASLQYELTKKATVNRTIDKIKQSSTSFGPSKSQDITTISNRRYNPTLDPQISKDLEKFRKQRQQTKIK